MIAKIIPHVCIVLSIIMLTLLILIKFNQWIMDTDFYNILLYVFFGIVFITSGILIAHNRRS